MSGSNVNELKAQFGRMQREVNVTLELLKKLHGDTVIIEICPPYCAPIKIVDPPRLGENCEVQIARIEGSITVQDTEDAIQMLDSWMENMIRVLREADQDLSLP